MALARPARRGPVPGWAWGRLELLGQGLGLGGARLSVLGRVRVEVAGEGQVVALAVPAAEVEEEAAEE